MRWLTRLGCVIALLLIAGPAHAKGYAERLITGAVETSALAGRAIVTPASVNTINCRLDVTIHDEVGTIAIKVQMCMFPFEIAGSEQCMSESAGSANYQSLLTSSTLATEGEEWLFVGAILPSGGNGTPAEAKMLFPPPIIWRVITLVTGGNESTYTVDCQWW